MVATCRVMLMQSRLEDLKSKLGAPFSGQGIVSVALRQAC